MLADLAWMYLIENSFPHAGISYWNSDQAFVDQWSHRIDDYETIFSGVTLVLSPDAGNYFPEMPTLVQDQPLFAKDCTPHKEDAESCAAKTDVLSYFVSKVGPNSKATRVGGMTASSPHCAWRYWPSRRKATHRPAEIMASNAPARRR